MAALFRIVELSSGSIRIDGLDIGEMGLNALRSKIAIIPQEAGIFSGEYVFLNLRLNCLVIGLCRDDSVEYGSIQRV
jgi:ABC-type multidrug transport system fused ATPase/permease subunit